MTPLRVAVAGAVADPYLLGALRRLGHEPVVVGGGPELLALCRSAPPDLVLADADGVAGAEYPVPVVLVCGDGDDWQLAPAAGAGQVYGHLVKPVRASQLGAALALAVRLFAEHQALARQVDALRQALEDRKLVERAKGAVVRRLHVDEDEAFLRLRKLSSRGNRKLAEVAQEVVDAEQVFHQLDGL